MKNRKTPLSFSKGIWRQKTRYLLYLTIVMACLMLFGLIGNDKLTSANGINQQGGSVTSIAPLSEGAQQQISALMAEKASRTPEQKKMSSQLLRAIKENRGEAFAAGLDNLRPVNIKEDSRGNVLLDIKVSTTDDSFLQKLTAYDVIVRSDFPQYNTIRVSMPMQNIEAMAALPEVLFIEPEMKAQLERGEASDNHSVLYTAPTPVAQTPFALRATNVRNSLPLLLASAERQKQGIRPNIGAVTSQGDTTHRAATARTTFGAMGQGIKIGVLSDTFNARGTANNDVLSGDLPGTGNPNGNTTPVTVLQDLVSGTDEGRAMLQIVHDIAPRAQLFFATAFGGVASFASNIQALRDAGCDIIIDDVFYFNESPFQDGPIAQAVNTVTANGALYFSSCGNAGNLKKNTAGVWEGDFVSGGTLANLPGGTVNNFTPTAPTPTIANIVPATGGNFYTLFWSDPLGASNNDYDIFIFDATLTVLFDFGTTVQNGTQDPFEITSGGAFAGDRVVIFKSDNAAPRALHLNTNRGRLTIATQGQTKGHNSAVNAFGTAAVPTGPASAGVPGPFPNPFGPLNLIENFTSDGPRRMFYNANGTPFTPGNLLFATNGGITRNKPDITAADGVSTTLPANSGLNPFFGTSAAAPHAGAIAALVKSANPSLTATQIRAILTLSAIDIEAAGFDNNSGFGIVDAFGAVQATQGQATITFGGFSFTETIPRNNNGVPDPGERGNVIVKLNNPTTTNATAVSATLTTTTAGVTISNPTINVGTITATSSVNSQFGIVLSSSLPCGTNIPFTLMVGFSGGTTSPVTFNFSLQTGRSAVNTISVTTVLDATAPPASTMYTASTGTQTGRLLRNGVAATCAAPKASPGLNDATVVRRFDAYVLRNTATTTQCMTVTLTQPTTALFSLAYNANGFIPASPAVNYAADPGASAATTTYSLNVPAGQQFTVVVHEVNANGGLNITYTLSVSSNVFACDPVNPFALENISIFVADTANSRIQRSDDDGATWVSIGFGPGTTAGKFNAPRGVAASSDNSKVFVADTANNRVQRSTDSGATWTVMLNPGTTPNAVNQPAGLTYDELNDKLYIADTNNNRVLVVTGASTATPTSTVFAGAAPGTGLGQFNQPRGVAIDLNGKVYVVDTGNNRIQVNSTGLASGWTIFANATAGTAVGSMNRPRGIFVDSNGKVYVADTGNNRIQVNSTGLSTGWTVFMSPGTVVDTVNGAEGVTVSSTGNVFIGDTLNNRVQRKPATGGTAVIVGPFGSGSGQFKSPTGVR
ncbi:MAG: S8 family serine peptidase [Acidobacteriota bacterium]